MIELDARSRETIPDPRLWFSIDVVCERRSSLIGSRDRGPWSRGAVSELTRGSARPWLLQSGSVDCEAALPINRVAESSRLHETAIHETT